MLVKKWSQTLNLFVKSVALVSFVLPSMALSQESAEAIESRITAIIEKMTVDQKVGQMVQPEIQEISYSEVKRYHIGSVLNGGGSFPDEEKDSSIADWLEMADK
ncbi:MAG: glycoside hydrolase family 3 protein, partial [Porticoccaceae bacterium]|nr:glycoside hydrolase family 3 protein [Porticoccaceae bacterium]